VIIFILIRTEKCSKNWSFYCINRLTGPLWSCESIDTPWSAEKTDFSSHELIHIHPLVLCKNLQFLNYYGSVCESAFEFDWGMESYYFLTFENTRFVSQLIMEGFYIKPLLDWILKSIKLLVKCFAITRYIQKWFSIGNYVLERSEHHPDPKLCRNSMVLFCWAR
jgi:hypothetical protein